MAGKPVIIHGMPSVSKTLASLWLMLLLPIHAVAESATQHLGQALLDEALAAKALAATEIRNDRYFSVIDYRAPSLGAAGAARPCNVTLPSALSR